jgi:lipopolysaccharide/colanic/teichoic acid biosynthesis glycosyltransferase
MNPMGRFKNSIIPYDMKRNAELNLKKLMIIVDDQNSEIFEEIMQIREWQENVVYILSDDEKIRAGYHYRSRIYPLRINIRSLLRHDIVDEIICCSTSLSPAYYRELIKTCNQFGVSLLIQDPTENTGLPVSGSRFVGDFLFYVLDTTPRKYIGYHFKTTSEILFAAIALIILSPLLLITSLMIKINSKGPVIFKQKRVGLRGRKFYIFKFRTMIYNAEEIQAKLVHLNESDGPVFKIKNDPRITVVGKLLRKTGIDEIPQLFNVVRGEMSLIGPRPMLPSEVSVQKEWQLKRMCIKPGITCTWQIKPKRNMIPFNEWMELDHKYVENWSIKNDLKIFFLTIKTMFAANGL